MGGSSGYDSPKRQRIVDRRDQSLSGVNLVAFPRHDTCGHRRPILSLLGTTVAFLPRLASDQPVREAASVRRNIDRQADFTAGGVPRFSADYNGCSSCLIAAATLSTTAVPAEASAIPINPTALNKPVTTTNATVAIVIATKATLVQS